MLITALSCGVEPGGSGDSEKVESIVTISQPIFLGSLDKFIDRADAVVIGGFSGEITEKIIPNRDQNDPEQIDPDNSRYGSVYHLNVDRYLLGDGPSSLDLYQNEGQLITMSGQIFESEDVTSFHPPKIGLHYLLMIRYLERNPEIVSGSARPWRFILTDEMARPDAESTSRFVIETFPPGTESEFIERIEEAIRAK